MLKYHLHPRRIRWRTGPIAVGMLLVPAIIGCSSSGQSATPETPGYTLSASPSALRIPAGGSGYAVVSVIRRSGFTGAVTLSVAGLPPGVVASGEIPGTGTTGYLTVAVDPGVSSQSWDSLSLEGVSGALASTAGFSLSVTAPLPLTSLGPNLVAAPGGKQAGGPLTNQSVFMEPVQHSLGTNASGTIQNRAGFLPDAEPSRP